MKTLVHALNAIETADEAANVQGLRDYCVECGLTDEQVQALVDMSGDTDLGRLHVFMTKEEVVEDVSIETADAGFDAEVVEEDTNADEISEPGRD